MPSISLECCKIHVFIINIKRYVIHYKNNHPPCAFQTRDTIQLSFSEPRWRNVPSPAAQPPATTAPSAGHTATAAPGAGSGLPAGLATDVDDLIHLRGPLTEDAVVRALQARFYHNKFYVSPRTALPSSMFS